MSLQYGIELYSIRRVDPAYVALNRRLLWMLGWSSSQVKLTVCLLLCQPRSTLSTFEFEPVPACAAQTGEHTLLEKAMGAYDTGIAN